MSLLLTVEQVAERLHRHANWVRAQCHAGLLPAAMVGGGYLISEDDLDAYVASRKPAPPAAETGRMSARSPRSMAARKGAATRAARRKGVAR